MFRTQYSDRKEVFTPVSSCIYYKYSPVYDKNGHYELERSGSYNLYKDIQARACDADLHTMVRQYLNGDPDALNRRSGSYGDYTDMPESYADLLNTYNRMRMEFYALPLEVRERFGQDFNSYLASAGSDAWLEKLGYKVMPENLDVVKESNNLDIVDNGGDLIDA